MFSSVKCPCCNSLKEIESCDEHDTKVGIKYYSCDECKTEFEVRDLIVLEGYLQDDHYGDGLYIEDNFHSEKKLWLYLFSQFHDYIDTGKKIRITVEVMY